MTDQQDDIEFLKAYRGELSVEYSQSAEPDYIDAIFDRQDPAKFWTTWDEKAERAAALADRYGEPRDGDVFREYLFREQEWVPGNDDHRKNLRAQVLTTSRIITRIRQGEENALAEDAQTDNSLTPLTRDQADVLAYLAKQKGVTRTMSQIESNTAPSLRKLKEIMPQLEGMSLVYRPLGRNRGYLIRPLGMQRFAEITHDRHLDTNSAEIP